MKKDSASKNHAYTLIELLIGISIISIIFSVGFASYRDFSRRQALTGVTKAIVSDLRTLQQKALAGEKPDTSCITLDGYKITIAASSYSLYADCSSDIFIKTVDLTANDITLSSTPVNTITFKVLGQGTDLTSDAVITLENIKIDRQSQVFVGKGGDIYSE